MSEKRGLIILQSEKQQVEIRLKQQIESAKNALENLEFKVNEDQENLSKSDGMQGYVIDSLLYELVTLNRAIDLFKKEAR